MCRWLAYSGSPIRLEELLVKRDRSSEDRRVVQVELTDEGRSLHDAALEGRLAFAKEMLLASGGMGCSIFLYISTKEGTLLA